MAIKIEKGKDKDKYSCSYCGKVFGNFFLADECRDNHNIIYLPLSSQDIGKLHQYIYTHDDRLLSETLIKQIKHYVKVASKKEAK